MSNFFKSVLRKIKNYLCRSKHQKNVKSQENNILKQSQYQLQLPKSDVPFFDLTKEEQLREASVQRSRAHIRLLFFGLLTMPDDNHRFFMKNIPSKDIL